MLIPGKLYKIKSFPYDLVPYELFDFLDAIPAGNISTMKSGSVLLYCKEVWVPNVKLYEFLYKGKFIYWSSYLDAYMLRVFKQL